MSQSTISLLTPAEMASADQATIASGTPGKTLMDRAGEGVAQFVMDHFGISDRVLVLCGPGNNGGDGWIAADYLQKAGYNVFVETLLSADQLKGDAAWAFERWKGRFGRLGDGKVAAFDVVIDALFGVGLSRALDDAVAERLRSVERAGIPIIAVDVPSGLDGLNGQIQGFAPRARATVTFHRKKPGHLLQPGRNLCGKLRLVDIGIDPTVDNAPVSLAFENQPRLWADQQPRENTLAHKYDRGHVGVVTGGLARTGAARLAAVATDRGGAGLVSLISPAAATLLNASHSTGMMVKPFGSPEELCSLIEQSKFTQIVVGPGLGTDTKHSMVLNEVLRAPGRLKSVVLDADALTLMATEPEAWFKKLPPDTVLTPHQGEFSRLFPDLDDVSKLERARKAAQRANALVIYKGSDTIVASPCGRAAINTNAPPALAKAGSGDVLAGMVAAAQASGLATFEAACAAVWYHGEAGRLLGNGLTAEALAQTGGLQLAQGLADDRESVS